MSDKPQSLEGHMQLYKPIHLSTRPYFSYATAVALGLVVCALIISSVCWNHYLCFAQGRVSYFCLPCLIGALFALCIWIGFARCRTCSLYSNMKQEISTAANVFCFSLILLCASGAIHTAYSEYALAVMKQTSVSSLDIVLDHDCAAQQDRFSVVGSLYLDGSYLGRANLLLPSAFVKGTSLRVVGRFESLSATKFDQGLFMRGIAANIQVIDVLEVRHAQDSSLIDNLRAKILAGMQPHNDDSSALLAATVCGYTADMSKRQVQQSFSACGITHLVAVSGGHLAVISAVLSKVCDRLSLSRGIKTLLILVCMGSYVGFSGSSASAVRSFAMVGIAQVVMLFNRRFHGLSSLAIAVIIMLCWNPFMVMDIGFELSALSVAFILLFSEYIAIHLESIHVPSSLANLLSLTFAAQWATMPLTLSLFGDLSLIAPLANLIIGPIMSAMLLLGLASSCFAVFAGYNSLLFIPAKALCQVSIFLSELLSMMPFASFYITVPRIILVGIWLVAVVVYIKWKPLPMKVVVRISACLLLLCVGWFSYWRYLSPAEVSVLDIGQGDCILIRDHSDCILVDCGLGKTTLDALVRNHVMNVDAVVITHWHDDHYGGLDEVLDYYHVDTMYCAQGALDDAPREVAQALSHSSSTASVELEAGDIIDCGSFSLECVWPKESVTGTVNEESIGLIGRCEKSGKRSRFLLTGDLEVSSEQQFVDEVGRIDFLKLGHHGSEVSVDEQILDILRPSVCVASCGYKNKYGHPTQTCIDCCEAASSLFISTIEAGDVHIRFDNEGVLLRRQFG